MSSSIVEEAIRILSEPLRHPIEDLTVLQQSLLFAELSRIAYRRPDIVWEAVNAVGFEEYEYIDRDGAQAYIISNQHDCIVVCRGTEPNDWNDIRADVDAISVVAETVGRVHRGSKKESDDLWPRLEKSLAKNDKPLWFAGHSLGGAMASICAGRCKISEIPSNPVGLFTFGSPRVGNKRFINFVKLRHYRWVNNNDIVTRVPPKWMGYEHSGQEIYLNAFGRVKRYRPWRRFRDRCYGFLITIRTGKIDHLSDHGISKYIEYISRAVADEAKGKLKPIPKQPIYG